jgi:hypothetical protein
MEFRRYDHLSHRLHNGLRRHELLACSTNALAAGLCVGREPISEDRRRLCPDDLPNYSDQAVSVDGTISLREAQAPLGPGEARFTLEAGVLIRGEVRRGAARHGVDWFEQKNWFDSFFVFRGPADAMLRFHAAVKDFELQLEEIEE